MDVLSDILKTMRVSGSFYFRTHFSPPWSVAIPVNGNVTRYHLVVRGSCTLKVADSESSVRLEQGDLILVTGGAAHELSDGSGTAETLSVDQLVTAAQFDGTGPLVFGKQNGTPATELVCGHADFEPERGGLLLDSLPPLIHVRSSEIAGYGWLASAMNSITREAYDQQPGTVALVSRIAEVIFIQTVRFYAQSAEDTTGIFAALQDRYVRRALHAIHVDVARCWTIDSLARAAGTSRTILAERMRDLLGMPPISYLTRWRLELAHEALSDGLKPIPEIAESVGYNSLSAFSRAFKKQFGRNPGAFRRQRSG